MHSQVNIYPFILKQRNSPNLLSNLDKLHLWKLTFSISWQTCTMLQGKDNLLLILMFLSYSSYMDLRQILTACRLKYNTWARAYIPAGLIQHSISTGAMTSTHGAWFFMALASCGNPKYLIPILLLGEMGPLEIGYHWAFWMQCVWGNTVCGSGVLEKVARPMLATDTRLEGWRSNKTALCNAMTWLCDQKWCNYVIWHSRISPKLFGKDNRNQRNS